MSPLNVHVNRIPASGRVAYKKYYPGKFLPAYRDKASTDNEQMHLGIATGKGPVLVKQIAGLVARRIVCHPQVGEEVRAGQRMGLIKLGSRLDVLMPLEWKVTVSPGQAVRAGETAIAAK
jgi:phosphatidylserine decarboxylase